MVFRVKTMKKKISRKGAETQRIYKMTENGNFGEAFLKDGIRRVVNDL